MAYHSLPVPAGAVLLSNNEKTLVAIAVIGIVGWFAFGSKIKKAMK